MTKSISSILSLSLLLAACGSANDSSIESQLDGLQDDSSSGPQTPGAGEPDSAVDSNTTGGFTPGPTSGASAPQADLGAPACQVGWEATPEEQRECAATFGGLCFESDEAACGCAGCADDQCRIAESYPTQVSCEQPARCDFVVDGECYEDAEEACAAAGCEPGGCVILESYPARAMCAD